MGTHELLLAPVPGKHSSKIPGKVTTHADTRRRSGATGGEFGTLFQDAGRDVTYLVRPRKQEVLSRDGLRFVSPAGDRTHAVKTITAPDASGTFDLILITVKATAFEGVVGEIGAFVG